MQLERGGGYSFSRRITLTKIEAKIWYLYSEIILPKEGYTINDIEIIKIVAPYLIKNYQSDPIYRAGESGSIFILGELFSMGCCISSAIPGAIRGNQIRCLEWLYYDKRIKWRYNKFVDLSNVSPEVDKFLADNKKNWVRKRFI